MQKPWKGTLDIPDDVPLPYRELARLSARALISRYTDDEAARSAEVARLAPELRKLVDKGKLIVRDPSTYAPLTFDPPLSNEALNRAVIFPWNLPEPLEEFDIEVRRIPHGSGHDGRWTVDGVVKAIGDREGMNDGRRDKLKAQLLNERQIDPSDELMSTADINAQLAKIREPGRVPELAPDLEREPIAPRNARPLRQQPHQEQEILRVIADLGFNPKALPKLLPGKRHGVKAEVRAKLQFSRKVFDKAWVRLRSSGAIQDATLGRLPPK